MSSFPAQARRVRMPELPVHERLLALRECALHFPPYGYRATWHHLLVNARIPLRLEDDPDSLLRAVIELEEARQLWTQRVSAYAARRRAEKAAGLHKRRDRDRWYAYVGQLAYCPDPIRHPSERLAVVVHRLIEAYSSGNDWSTLCPACGRSRSLAEPCPGCGVDPRGHDARFPADIRALFADRWDHIWRRTAYLEGEG